MDDEKIIRDVVTRMIKKLGYDVICVNNGEEAVSAYKKSLQNNDRFDAVILDLTVIGGSGGEKIIHRLKNYDQNVKAIVSSGYADNLILNNPQKYGFAGKIAKPYQLYELDKELANVIFSE